MQAFDVVIVGAGITGLTLACSLARLGVKAVLIDEDNTVGVKGASRAGWPTPIFSSRKRRASRGSGKVTESSPHPFQRRMISVLESDARAAAPGYVPSLAFSRAFKLMRRV